MKIVLEQMTTGLYFKSDGVWVKSEAEAMSFSGSLEAMDFCQKHGLNEVVIVLKFSNPRHDLRLYPFHDGPAPERAAGRAE